MPETIKPKEMSAANVHATAVEMLELPFNYRIADVPCGAGALTQRLLDQGYTNVLAADINLEDIAVKGKTECARVDLNQPLPFGNGAFDGVFCIECIEHLENPFHLMRELARILRPGGTLILSTPNIMSTNARSKYLTSGHLPHFFELACRWEEVKEAGYQGHIMPIPLTLLLYLAYINDLQVTDMRTNKYVRRFRWKDRFLAFIIKHMSRRFYPPETYALISSDIALYGDILIVKFAKPGAAKSAGPCQ
jgi:SAM-dependent methyltransferase